MQNEVGTMFFRHELLTKNALKISPKVLSLYFVCPRKSCKIAAKSPAKCPAPKSNKKSPTIFCRSARRTIGLLGALVRKCEQSPSHRCKPYFAPVQAREAFCTSAPEPQTTFDSLPQLDIRIRCDTPSLADSLRCDSSGGPEAA